MLTQDVPNIVRTLDELLHDAGVPSKEGDPLVLVHQNVGAYKITEICVVKSDQEFRKPGADKTDNKTIGADDFIKCKLDLGFQVMNMSIVRTHSYAESTVHVVLTVLVKLRTE